MGLVVKAASPVTERAVERQRLDQFQSFDAFAAVWRHRERADCGPELGRKRVQHVHAGAGLVLTAAHALAVDRDVPEAAFGT